VNVLAFRVDSVDEDVSCGVKRRRHQMHGVRAATIIVVSFRPKCSVLPCYYWSTVICPFALLVFTNGSSEVCGATPMLNSQHATLLPKT
jgi:hypothetical protein